MPSSVSVTLDIALTTTNGRSFSRDLTMLIAREIAAASCTEVPPNFMTIIGPPACGSSVEVALGLQKFSVEQCRAGRAANRVVRQDGELPVEDAAGAQPADGHGHAGAAVNVKARLRTVGRAVVNDGWLGRAGQVRGLRDRRERPPGGDDLVRRSLRFQLHGNGFGVSVFHRHTVTLRADRERRRNNALAVQTAEQLERLLLHLF